VTDNIEVKLFSNTKVSHLREIDNLFTGDDLLRLNCTIEGFETHNGFCQIHALLKDNTVIGFIATKGALPSPTGETLALELTYVLIAPEYRDKGFSKFLVEAYQSSLKEWLESCFSNNKASQSDPINFVLVISPASSQGRSFRKNCLKGLFVWLEGTVLSLLNGSKNRAGTKIIHFDTGVSDSIIRIQKGGKLELISKLTSTPYEVAK